jgi:hypothetical protein
MFTVNARDAAKRAESVDASTKSTLPFSDDDRDRGKALMTANKWIVRRTESVNLRDDTQVARRVVVDFYVPPSADGCRIPRHLPLTLLRKVAPASNIDFVDEEDRSVSLLSLRENAGLSATALNEALEFVLPELPHLETARTCWQLASGTPNEAVEALKRLTALIVEHRRPRDPYPEYQTALRIQRLILIARTLAMNSIIWVMNDCPAGTRRVIKFTYEEPVEILSSLLKRLGIFLGLRSVKLGFKTPHLRSSQTYHFEMSVPGSLELHDADRDVDIHEATDIASRRDPTFFKTFRRDLHLYYDLVGTRTLVSNRISVKCRAGRRGFLSLALASAVLIAALLWSAWLLRKHLDSEAASQAIPPVMLLVPAVLVSMVNRPGEHPFNALLLTGPRYLIALSGVFASVAAAVVAFVATPSESEAVTGIWLGCAIGSSLVALLILWSWVSSLPVTARWGFGAGAFALAGAALSAWAILDGWWSWRSALLLIICELASALCGRRGLQRPRREPYMAYFARDLREAGILPS